MTRFRFESIGVVVVVSSSKLVQISARKNNYWVIRLMSGEETEMVGDTSNMEMCE